MCHVNNHDSKFCRAKSLLICRRSNRKWHFKDPSDNATRCKPSFQRDLPLFVPPSPAMVHCNNSVTLTTVSKHQFHLVLQCGVNNAEWNTRPQSFNRDGGGGGGSNSTAAATFIRKSQDVGLSAPLFHPLLCPCRYRCQVLVLLFFFFPHVSRHNRNQIFIRDSTCRRVLTRITRSHLPACSCK